MNASEINIAVAEKLGLPWHKPTEEEVKSGSYYQYEPNFHTDANLRPQMLASLTGEQKVKLCQLAGVSIQATHMHGWITLLELTQPQFCELYLKVTGGRKG